MGSAASMAFFSVVQLSARDDQTPLGRSMVTALLSCGRSFPRRRSRPSRRSRRPFWKIISRDTTHPPRALSASNAVPRSRERERVVADRVRDVGEITRLLWVEGSVSCRAWLFFSHPATFQCRYSSPFVLGGQYSPSLLLFVRQLLLYPRPLFPARNFDLWYSTPGKSALSSLWLLDPQRFFSVVLLAPPALLPARPSRPASF